MVQESVRRGTGAPPARRQGLVLLMPGLRKANARQRRPDNLPGNLPGNLSSRLGLKA